MNVKYGIINVRMLIKFNEQLNSFLGKNCLEMKWSFCLIELSRTFLQIIFLTKQSYVMTKINLGVFQEKNNTFKSYILSDKNPQIFKRVKSPQKQLQCLILKEYYLRISEKLMDPITSAKTYWSILKTLLNNKKIPCIHQLFHRGKYVAGFKRKLNYLIPSLPNNVP